MRIVWPDENIPPFATDVVVYRWERRPIAADGQLADTPDIAIEIVSPGQPPSQVGDRCAEHVERGLVWALMLDPESRTAHPVQPDRRPTVAATDHRR
jgi:Uma2 family endonuclease